MTELLQGCIESILYPLHVFLEGFHIPIEYLTNVCNPLLQLLVLVIDDTVGLLNLTKELAFVFIKLRLQVLPKLCHRLVHPILSDLNLLCHCLALLVHGSLMLSNLFLQDRGKG